MDAMPVTGAPVPYGPRAYRSKLRTLGPFAALLIPALLGLTSIVLLRGNTSTVRGVGGFVSAVLGAPLLLAAGVPLTPSTSARQMAVVASAVLWLLVGVVASRRATRAPVATWRDFWNEYLWLACGIWAGVVGALLAANLVLGRALF